LNAKHVERLFDHYHEIYERQFKGDYNAVIILIDLADAIERAYLTDRQKAALSLLYIEGFTQPEAAQRMNVTKQTISTLAMTATRKIAKEF